MFTIGLTRKSENKFITYIRCPPNIDSNLKVIVLKDLKRLYNCNGCVDLDGQVKVSGDRREAIRNYLTEIHNVNINEITIIE